MRKSFLIILCLGGCMSMGQKITPEQMSTLQQGTTTEQQAIGTLGEPSNAMTMPDGTKTDTWTYFGTQIDPITFVPMAGALLGGARTQTNSLTLTFDTRGILASKSVSNGQTAMNTGLLRQ